MHRLVITNYELNRSRTSRRETARCSR